MFEGAGIPVTSLYSCDRTRSKRLQATTDALFEELDNGNLSDVDGEFDEFDDESVVSCAPDEDPVESDTESSDDESAVNTSGSWTSRRQTFFFDNYFTSLPLLRGMLGKKIFAAGTIRLDRCEKCPLKTEKELKKSGRGSSDCVVSADGNIAITRWMDSRTVTLASNFIAIKDEDSVRHWNKAEKCYVDVK
ncbi:hypothetical protein HPB51_008560 [Rhipicephalus microplus]|uniref:PiggyBac transposable element-derived protein domain-containing protein n=1 Tax=Rhipicephalus microplus TaxID=6941 RepID=A0A9J6D4M2_RHIMP|nr:hypothetical protein HPB51_008560 [Rhipicephalus microplus]